MNIFQYLDYYIKSNNTTYSGIDNKDNSLKQMLSRNELEIYESIKKSDYNRLMKFS